MNGIDVRGERFRLINYMNVSDTLVKYYLMYDNKTRIFQILKHHAKRGGTAQWLQILEGDSD